MAFTLKHTTFQTLQNGLYYYYGAEYYSIIDLVIELPLKYTTNGTYTIKTKW